MAPNPNSNQRTTSVARRQEMQAPVMLLTNRKLTT